MDLRAPAKEDLSACLPQNTHVHINNQSRKVRRAPHLLQMFAFLYISCDPWLNSALIQVETDWKKQNPLSTNQTGLFLHRAGPPSHSHPLVLLHRSTKKHCRGSYEDEEEGKDHQSWLVLGRRPEVFWTHGDVNGFTETNYIPSVQDVERFLTQDGKTLNSGKQI